MENESNRFLTSLLWGALTKQSTRGVRNYGVVISVELCQAVAARLEAYDKTGYSLEDFDKLCRDMSDLRMALDLDTYDDLRRMIKDHRVIILPAPAKEGDKKPSCFYSYPGGIWCPGEAPQDGDEPTERCKNCWYCEYGYAAEDGNR